MGKKRLELGPIIFLFKLTLLCLNMFNRMPKTEEFSGSLQNEDKQGLKKDATVSGRSISSIIVEMDSMTLIKIQYCVNCYGAVEL